MISQSCEIYHSECHCQCGGGRHTVSQICQARSPDKNLGPMDPRALVSCECCARQTQAMVIARTTESRSRGQGIHRLCEPTKFCYSTLLGTSFGTLTFLRFVSAAGFLVHC